MKKVLFASVLALCSMTAMARDIKAGVQCTYPPFNYRDTSGELKGFEIDIAREMAKRMNANVQFVCLSFDGLTAFLRGLQIASYKLPERLEVVTQFPLSPVGKILRRELRDAIAARLDTEAKV